MKKILLAGLAVAAVFIVYATLYIAYALADERMTHTGAETARQQGRAVYSSNRSDI